MPELTEKRKRILALVETITDEQAIELVSEEELVPKLPVFLPAKISKEKLLELALDIRKTWQQKRSLKKTRILSDRRI